MDSETPRRKEAKRRFQLWIKPSVFQEAEELMQDNSKIKNVFVCFDNDEAGQTAAQKLCEKLTSMNISAGVLVPVHKDWNEDLLHYRRQEQKAGIQNVM